MPSRCAGCCAIIGNEFRRPMFDLVEHPTPSEEERAKNATSSDDNGTPTIDIEKTFSPRPRLPYIGAKLFIAAWTMSIMTLSIRKVKYPSFWLAYLTHWGLIVATAYAIMSVFSAGYLAKRPPADPSALEGGTGLMVKTTWALFATAAPAEIIISILFWAIIYEGGPVDYVDAMQHAGTAALIIIDGFLLSRIPLRMKQFIVFETFSALYVLWTIIHAYSGIGNPLKDDGTKDDDSIYEGTMQWKTDTVAAVVLSVLVLFVVNPVIFLLCRAVSRALPRRLFEKDETEFKGQEQEQEPESVTDEEAVAVVY